MPVRAIAVCSGAKLLPGVLAGLLLALLALVGAPAALAHGVVIESRPGPGFILEARYDNGEAMGEATVLIYAPDDPGRVWQSGRTDAAGRFAFVADPQLPGTWSVQVRQDGHGAMIHIVLAADDQALVVTTVAGHEHGRRWLTSLAVVWGLIGTALYFQRRRS